MVFDRESDLVQEEEQALKLIREIELPCCLNLALCYNKEQQWHYTIKYASQALEKEPDNSKALFRRGYAYLQIGEFQKARTGLVRANELSSGNDGQIIQALRQLKDKLKQQGENEKNFAKGMLGERPQTESKTEHTSNLV